MYTILSEHPPQQAADALAEARARAEAAKGKGQQQKLLALEKQVRHEQAKHMERQARLTRIRELAAEKGDTEAVARVDKLLARQQEIHGRKQQHLQGQRRAAQQPQAAPAPAPAAQAAPAPVESAPVEVPQPVPEAEAPTE